MEGICSLLDELANKDWGGWSLMQEAKLSGGIFVYHHGTGMYPYAFHLSFTIETVTYTVSVGRKTQDTNGTWTPVTPPVIAPLPPAEHLNQIAHIIRTILANPTGAT